MARFRLTYRFKNPPKPEDEVVSREVAFLADDTPPPVKVQAAPGDAQVTAEVEASKTIKLTHTDVDAKGNRSVAFEKTYDVPDTEPPAQPEEGDLTIEPAGDATATPPADAGTPPAGGAIPLGAGAAPRAGKGR